MSLVDAIMAAAIVVPLALANQGSPTTGRDAKPSLVARQTAAGRCQHYAKRHHFLKADSAVVDRGGAVTITGHQGYETCDVPDDVDYDWHRAVVTFTVTPSAVVYRFRMGKNGPSQRKIAPTALPSYLRHDPNTRFFQYTGPRTGISRMTELYHP